VTLPIERERRWVAGVRMPEGVVEELLVLVEPHMAPSVPRNTQHRTCTVRETFLENFKFLVHSSSLRQMATKFRMPHCIVSVLCLLPTVRALRKVFKNTSETKKTSGGL
jgi:hypothetical protein